MLGIISCSDNNFKTMVDHSVKQTLSFGYYPIVYDLNDLGYGQKFITDKKDWENTTIKDCPQFTFKPRLALKAFSDNFSLQNFVFMDADCIMVNTVNEVFANINWDVAVTIREPWEWERFSDDEKIFRSYINSGVVFFGRTSGTKIFLNRWLDETVKGGQDQIGLANACDITKHYQKVGSIVEVNGVRIKLLPTKIYNHYYFNKKDYLVNERKILHFKRGMRKYYQEIFPS